MMILRVAAVCLAIVFVTPEVARSASSTCDDYFDCFSGGGDCPEADLLLGTTLGAVDSIGGLLCFIGDNKCGCFDRITSPSASIKIHDAWLEVTAEIVASCGQTASGGRALSGIAFEAANAVCDQNFADDVSPILEANCAVCHVSSSSGNFNFGNGLSALVNAPSEQTNLPYITPGDPAASYLFHKVNGSQQEAGGSGSTMPLGGMLSDADIAVIEAWILSGAQ